MFKIYRNAEEFTKDAPFVQIVARNEIPFGMIEEYAKRLAREMAWSNKFVLLMHNDETVDYRLNTTIDEKVRAFLDLNTLEEFIRKNFSAKTEKAKLSAFISNLKHQIYQKGERICTTQQL